MAVRHALRTLVSFAAVLTATSSFAQSIGHDVSVTIPSSLGIRVVGAGGGPRAVEFDYADDAAAFLSATDYGVQLAPTAVNRFDDIEVNISGVGVWELHVVATPFEYTGSGSGAGINVSDVRVLRGSASGLTPGSVFLRWGIFSTYDSSWTLSTTPRRIASSLIGTFGWRSLGFNGWDYSLAVDGDEDAGSYTTSVTYSLTFP